jgi:hypothetical protein
MFAGTPSDAESQLAARLVPQPRELHLGSGSFATRGFSGPLAVPGGPEHEACRAILDGTMRACGATPAAQPSNSDAANRFTLGTEQSVPALPNGASEEAYVLSIGPNGITAAAASPAGLLYAAQTLRQLVRQFSENGCLPALTIVDYPDFKLRGIYIEGGQERYGRIVAADYLREQIRRLSEFKMNTMVIECYNLFPFKSFPACADSGTLSREDCRSVFAEAKKYHITLIPSLQTLAQASELVWGCDAGTPYREATAPGLMCPSTPEIYPFIKSLYRDLLEWFDTAPIIGVGCSEIEMQWQNRYCPKCQKRVQAGESVRDLLLGHAEQCIRAVQELRTELKRPVQPLIWADEFYMYGPGKDWVGIQRIPRDTVMGYWKYWADYDGIGGLLSRGYDVVGISAMYNHTFYLADISPQSPHKTWAPMEQTGTRNITEMVQAAAAQGQNKGGTFRGVATASFSKHRLRAFDSIWYGFALNGRATWSRSSQSLDEYQADFTRAFVRHFYDCRTEAAASAMAEAWTQLDDCKSQLESANQTLHDVIGIYDTQEPGYQGNTLLGSLRNCERLLNPEGSLSEPLLKIHTAANTVRETAGRIRRSLETQRPQTARNRELDDLLICCDKIFAHAERQSLMIDTCGMIARAPSLSASDAASQAAGLSKRWSENRDRAEAISRCDARLYTQGDPCGHAALLREMSVIQAHLAGLAHPVSNQATEVLLREPFATLDASRWIVLGKPRLADGWLETSVSGGWENRCGIATREKYTLDETRPLVVEFTLVPVKIGIDSQVFASASDTGIDSFQFAFYAFDNRFAVHTQSKCDLPGGWQNTKAGWFRRTESGPVEPNKPYRIRAEVRRTALRVVVRAGSDDAWHVPFWDSGLVPMDPIEATHLRFADVEPDGKEAASRWHSILIQRE